MFFSCFSLMGEDPVWSCSRQGLLIFSRISPFKTPWTYESNSGWWCLIVLLLIIWAPFRTPFCFRHFPRFFGKFLLGGCKTYRMSDHVAVVGPPLVHSSSRCIQLRGYCCGTLAGAAAAFTCVSIAPRGFSIAAGCEDGAVHLWSTVCCQTARIFAMVLARMSKKCVVCQGVAKAEGPRLLPAQNPPNDEF